MKKLLLVLLLVVGFGSSGLLAQGDAQSEDIVANPGDYVGQTVTVEGTANILSNNVVEIMTTTADAAPSTILAVPYPNDQYGIDINNGMRLRVTGTLQAFDIANLESTLGYDLNDDELTNFDDQDYAIVATDVRQLGGPRTATGNVSIADFESNPSAYYNATVTVEGITNIISNNLVELTQTQPFDLSPNTLLMVPGPEGTFSIDVNNGQRVRVTGTFFNADQPALESGLGYEFDEEAFSSYDTNDHVLVALGITLLSEAGAGASTSLNDVTANPQNFYDQNVTITGYIAEEIDTTNGRFILRSDNLLNSDRAIVLATTDAASTLNNRTNLPLVIGDRVTVSGTVRGFEVTDLESELGYDIDETRYTGYEGLPTIVADSIEAAPENAGMPDAAAVQVDAGASGATTAGTFDTSNYPQAGADVSLDDVTDNLAAYSGQIVTVNGSVGDSAEAGRSFYLWDDDLLDPDAAVVIAANQSAMDAIGNLLADEDVAIRGIVRPLNFTDLETEFGLELDNGAYAGADIDDETPVIVALEIIPNLDN